MGMKIGDLVRSKSVGSKPAFDGEIVGTIGVKVYAYRVRDAAGLLWHRVTSELSLIELEPATPRKHRHKPR